MEVGAMRASATRRAGQMNAEDRWAETRMSTELDLPAGGIPRGGKQGLRLQSLRLDEAESQEWRRKRRSGCLAAFAGRIDVPRLIEGVVGESSSSPSNDSHLQIRGRCASGSGLKDGECTRTAKSRVVSQGEVTRRQLPCCRETTPFEPLRAVVESVAL